MHIELSAPAECADAIISELSSRRAYALEQVSNLEHTRVCALVPLVNMFKYIDTLALLSRGKANYSMRFEHYA